MKRKNSLSHIDCRTFIHSVALAGIGATFPMVSFAQNKKKVLMLGGTIVLTMLLSLGFSTLSFQAQDASLEQVPLVRVYKTVNGIKLSAYLFLPPAQNEIRQGRPAVVLFHGGGWSAGEPEWVFGRARMFAARGMVAVAVQYRLSDQQSVTPLEAMADARDAIRWLRRNAKSLGVDPTRIAAYGVSAGAQLAAAAAIFDDRPTSKSEDISSSPNALLFSPAVSVRSDEWMQKLLGKRAKAQEISPDAHVRSGLPPMILFQGSNDTVTPADGAQQFCDRMKRAGNQCDLHIYKGLKHLLQPPDSDSTMVPVAANARADAVAKTDRFLVSLGFLSELPSLTKNDMPIDGYWEGIVADKGKELRINVEFKSQPDGLQATIDVPDLYILGYKLNKVSYQAGKLHFELPLGSQPETFDGVFDGKDISGTYSGRFYKEEARSAIFRLWREKRDPSRYKPEEVTFQNGDTKLAGTLFMPTKKGKHPAVVLFHGSGPQTRESYLRFFADLFARHGIATLIYDKRGTGGSTGEVWYKTGDQFDDLVADSLAGVQLLLKRTDIDPKKVGLWGLSQGGWLAPLAASRSKDIAFLIVVSGGGVTPAEQELYDDEVKLRDKGFSEEEIREAVALLRLADDVIRKREPLEKFVAAREEAQKQPWFVHLDRYPVKLPKEDPTWRSRSAGLDFDPRPLWEKTPIPTLAIFGEADKSTPSEESARRVELALSSLGNKDHTIKIIPNADHALLVSPGKGAKWDWDRPAPGWLDLMVNWLQKHTR